MVRVVTNHRSFNMKAQVVVYDGLLANYRTLYIKPFCAISEDELRMSTDSEDDEISHEPEEFESYAPYLKLFFGLDKAKIRKVIDAVNKEGSAISYSKISRMTDLPVGSAALGVLDSLSYLGHSALAHESLEEDIKNSELADDTKEGIRH